MPGQPSNHLVVRDGFEVFDVEVTGTFGHGESGHIIGPRA
jgi:hypothetical protein